MKIRHLTEEELRFIVNQVLAGERRPLDMVLTEAIFEDSPPATWGGWPKEAVEMWAMGCDMYQRQTTSIRNTKEIKKVVLTLELSWKIVLAVAPEEDEWWRLNGITWADIGRRVGLAPRRASYRMTNLGWRMAGAGMKVPDRRIVSAPCEVCGTPWRPEEIVKKWGPCCEEHRC